ncbi:MAG: helix-turn-helix domain-containing protein [Ruminococcus sp.]|nr:helix-turn-helix domain-containing protein [Ruminococcus sp.]
MTRQPELTSVLSELKKLTGVSLEIKTNSPDDTRQAAIQLQRLCAAYKEKYDKTHFLKNILYNNISAYDINEQALKLHINPEDLRILFLLEIKNSPDDTIIAILRHLFPSQTGIYIIPVSDTKLVLLYPISDCDIASEELIQIAHSMIDTLNMEALASVQASCSLPIQHLSQLSKAFEQATLALNVGKLFNSEQNVFLYNRLGIGRLIYQLPISVCDDFLHEIFADEIPDALETDLSSTIDRFLQNNLNIAETARQLHMHRNTLIYRLEQIKKRTGLDLRNFEDAMTFKTAIMVMNYRKQK